MAELQVEPRRKSPWIQWVLLLLVLIILGIFLGRRNSHQAASDMRKDSTTADAAAASGGAPETASDPKGPSADQAWGDINQNAPGLAYDEIHDKNIRIRGTDTYTIYDVGEDVLFDKNKSTIRPDAARNLKEIAASIAQRFNNGPVRLYGFTDAQGSSDFNKELAQSRAESVKQWLVANGNISSSRITTQGIGEANARATNSTEQGRQLNRRVQIVVKKAA